MGFLSPLTQVFLGYGGWREVSRPVWITWTMSPKQNRITVKHGDYTIIKISNNESKIQTKNSLSLLWEYNYRMSWQRYFYIGFLGFRYLNAYFCRLWTFSILLLSLHVHIGLLKTPCILWSLSLFVRMTCKLTDSSFSLINYALWKFWVQ